MDEGKQTLHCLRLQHGVVFNNPFLHTLDFHHAVNDHLVRFPVRKCDNSASSQHIKGASLFSFQSWFHYGGIKYKRPHRAKRGMYMPLVMSTLQIIRACLNYTIGIHIGQLDRTIFFCNTQPFYFILCDIWLAPCRALPVDFRSFGTFLRQQQILRKASLNNGLQMA